VNGSGGLCGVTRPAVRQLAQQIEMADVPRGLLDEVMQDPAHCPRCLDPEVVERVGRNHLVATPGFPDVRGQQVGQRDAVERTGPTDVVLVDPLHRQSWLPGEPPAQPRPRGVQEMGLKANCPTRFAFSKAAIAAWTPPPAATP
jgi:hypothetical protein